MTKFDRGTQKVHGNLSKLSFGYIKGIPFLYFHSQHFVPFLYLISVWVEVYLKIPRPNVLNPLENVCHEKFGVQNLVTIHHGDMNENDFQK